MFTNGISNGLNASIPFGGHILPISIVGEMLAAKNAQKMNGWIHGGPPSKRHIGICLFVRADPLWVLLHLP